MERVQQRLGEELPRPLGPYLLQRRIGRGGMGTVYLGTRRGPAALHTPVAIKVLRSDAIARDRRARGRLIREARLGALIRHPNVVRVLDMGEVDGQLYVVMEWVDGLSLDDLLTQMKAVPAAATLEIALQTAAGLAAVHDVSIARDERVQLVHRDLKPANLLIARSGQIRIADFGIAHLAGKDDDETSILGTPGYMSPEQIAAEELDGRSDLFSLGALLYRVHTGERLFGGKLVTAFQKIRKIDERLSEIRARLDQDLPGLGEVVARCLHFEREDRWEDAHALWGALEMLRWRVQTPGSLSGLVEQYAPRGVEALPMSGSLSRGTPEASSLVGRADMMEALEKTYNNARLVTLTGPPGIGKSALARAFGANSGDSVCWVSVAGCKIAAGLVRVVAAAIGVGAGTAQGGSLAAALKQQGPTLLVLDGLDEPVSEIREVLRSWLYGAPELKLLVTSRRTLGLSLERVLRVPPLDEASAEVLLRHRAGAGVDDTSLLRMLDMVDGLPMAIELAAANLRAGGSETTLTAPMQEGLEEALQWSWRRLTAWERSALIQCSIFRSTFTFGDAKAVISLEDHEAAPELAEALDALLGRRLLRLIGDRLRVSRPVRVYASNQRRRWLGPVGQKVSTRHARRFSRLGSNERLLELAGPNALAAFERIQVAEEDLLAVARRGARGAAPVLGARACRALYAICGRAAPSEELDVIGVALLARQDLPARERLRLRLERLRLLQLDSDYSPQSRRECNLALAAAMQMGLDSEAASARRILASTSLSAGNYEEATKHLESAYEHARAAGDRRVEARVLRLAARIYSRRGRNAAALQRLQRALTLARSCGDRFLEGRVLGLTGLIRARMGDLDVAGPILEAALEQFQAIGDRQEEALVLQNLSFMHQRSGALHQASDELKAAAEIYDRFGLELHSARMAHRLAGLQAEFGALDESIAGLLRALVTYRAYGDEEQTATAFCDLGSICILGGRLDDAERYLRQGAALAARSSRRILRFIIDVNRAEVALRKGDTVEAARLAQRSLDGGRALKDPVLQGYAQFSLGGVAMGEGRFLDAITLLERAVALMSGSEALGMIRAQLRLAQALAATGQLDAADAALRSADEGLEATGLGPGSALYAERAALRVR